MGFPLSQLAEWEPFRLDALGLVTLIGAEEVCLAIGALQSNLFTDYLPLFGSFLVAEDKITTPLPGYSLYNISDGVYVPVISGWFSRWLLANLTEQATRLHWEVAEKTPYLKDRAAWRARMFKKGTPIFIGAVANSGLIAVAALQGDYYGIANAVAMLVSVLVRRFVMSEKRTCLNDRIRRKEKVRSDRKKAAEENTPRQKPEDQEQASVVAVTPPDEDPTTPPDKDPPTPPDKDPVLQKRMDEELVKVIVTTPEDKVAIFQVNRCFVAYIIADLAIPVGKLTKQRQYLAARAIGWIAFAVHVLCIGQANLVSQLLSVGILICATILTIHHLGSDAEEAGGKLRISQTWTGDSRRKALLKMGPTGDEVGILQSYWHLPCQLEHKTSSAWAMEFWGRWTEDLPLYIRQLEEERKEQDKPRMEAV